MELFFVNGQVVKEHNRMNLMKLDYVPSKKRNSNGAMDPETGTGPCNNQKRKVAAGTCFVGGIPASNWWMRDGNGGPYSERAMTRNAFPNFGQRVHRRR